MSQPQDFNFYLRKKNGANFDYYSVNSSNTIIITTSATPINPLNFAPKGWKELGYTDKRGFQYKGIFRSISVPLEFVRDGAKILRSIFFNGGVNGDIELYIEQFNRVVGVYDYQLWYRGEIDFNTAKSDRTFFTAKVVEGGFVSKLESRADTNYKIEITNNPLVRWLHLAGINLQFRQVWISAPLEVMPSNIDVKVPTFAPLAGEGSNQTWGIYKEDNTTPSDINLISNLSSVTETLTLKYDYNLSILISSGSPNNAYLEIIHNIYEIGVGFVSQISAYLSPTIQLINTQQSYVGSVTNTINLPSNHKVITVVAMRISAGVYLNPTLYYTATQINSKLTLTSDIRTKEGYIPMLQPYDVFQSIIDQLSDNEATAISTLLVTTHKDKWITSGDAVRNLDNANMYISLDTLYKSFDAIIGASLSYDRTTGEVSLEGTTNVFQNFQIADLGNDVVNVECKPFTEKLYSKINIGYKDNTYDEVNGKDEFNTDIEFLSPLSRVTQPSDNKSIIRTDVYGIELQRLNLSDKKVTDGESDNDIFMIHVDDDYTGSTIPANYQGYNEPYCEVYQDVTLTITNIYSPQTMYNIFFSPKRCYLRNGAWHHSLMYGNDSEVVKFIKSSKSNELGLYMVTNDGVTIINEGTDIPISSLADIIFKPFLIELETYTTIAIKDLMETNPYGYISWQDEYANNYDCFVIGLERDAKVLSKTKLTLLPTPSTDLTNLI